MAHSIPQNIELTHRFNKIIRVGKSAKFITPKDRTLRISIDGDWLDKPIQVYRMWYRFLQLALELEEQKIHIITKMEKTELKKPKKDKWGKLQQFEMVPIKQKVKVNRKKYEGWDLDIIPFTSFDDWWKGKKKKGLARTTQTNLSPEDEARMKIQMFGISSHKELFYPERSVEVLNSADDWVADKKYTYLRIDNRRRINEIEKDVRTFFVGEREKGRIKEYESVSDFPVNGKPNVNTLINRYNSLILQLTSMQKDKEMLASNVFRPTKEGMGEEEEGAYSYSGSPGRAMRDLILPAKISLLSVCDGYFVQNPTKEYL